MKVSVIIPTYKPKDYLWECLDSVCKQTFDKCDFEIVLILNGCKDPFDTAVREYICSKPEINWKYIQTDEAGVSNARNIALDNARGEYITFIDDDDFISPSYIQELYDNASKDVVSLCYPLSFEEGSHKYEEYYITGNFKKNNTKNIKYTKARKYFSGPVYKLIYREIIGNRRFDKRFANGEDSIFMFLISDRFKFIRFTSKNAIYYRRVRLDGALSRKKRANKVVVNQLHMIWVYSKIYFSNPFSYNFSFYFTRVLGAIHGAIEQFVL